MDGSTTQPWQRNQVWASCNSFVVTLPPQRARKRATDLSLYLFSIWSLRLIPNCPVWQAGGPMKMVWEWTWIWMFLGMEQLHCEKSVAAFHIYLILFLFARCWHVYEFSVHDLVMAVTWINKYHLTRCNCRQTQWNWMDGWTLAATYLGYFGNKINIYSSLEFKKS